MSECICSQCEISEEACDCNEALLVVDQLRQQLAAEQSNSAEWKFKFENMEQCMLNMTVWKNQEKDRVNQAEATIAAMRSEIELQKIKSCNNCKHFDRKFIYTLNGEGPCVQCIVGKKATHKEWQPNDDMCENALSNTAGAEYSRVKKLEDIVRAVEWSGEGQRSCEETGNIVCVNVCLICGKRRIDGHYKDCPVKAVLGEGKADA